MSPHPEPMFDEYELPIAYSMLALARRSDEEAEPFHQFVFAWTAFNNVYATLGDRMGLHPTLVTDSGGRTLTRIDGAVHIPRVRAPSERDQLSGVLTEMSQESKEKLLSHSSVRFFADRTPCWEGAKLTTDVRGERLNGVIVVNRTVNADEPVWSPIDLGAYERYLTGRGADERELLVRQVLFLLYTVRNNLVHGGKRGDDANDAEVVRMALPLLKIFLEGFVLTDS